MTTKPKGQNLVILGAFGSLVVIVGASAAKGKFPSARQGIAAGFLWVLIAGIADADPSLAGPAAGLAFTSIGLAEGLQFAGGLGKVKDYKGSLAATPSTVASAQSPSGVTPVPGGAAPGPFRPTSPVGPAGSKQAANVVSVAQSWIGVPYRFGGESRSGIDCSGLAQAVYGAVGVKVPRVSEAQYAAFPHSTDTSKLQPGDEVFFWWKHQAPPDHCGIYIGGGQFIAAPHTGTNVSIFSLNDYATLPGVTWYGFTRPLDPKGI